MSTVDTEGSFRDHGRCGYRTVRAGNPIVSRCEYSLSAPWLFPGIPGTAATLFHDMAVTFAVTWDYRCPFARNAHEHVLTGLTAGADWQVRYLPFSLGQAHVDEGHPSVWEKPEQDSGILALQAGVVVRDDFPDRFPAVHRALFAARHDEGLHLEDRSVIERVLADHAVPVDAVFARIDSGAALDTVRTEHEQFVVSHNVWGVPTFIVGDQAVFKHTTILR